MALVLGFAVIRGGSKIIGKAVFYDSWKSNVLSLHITKTVGVQRRHDVAQKLLTNNW